jgi:hypothetical protein
VSQHSWSDFEAAAPELAARGRRLLVQGGTIDGLLATVDGSELPRLNPISAELFDGHLYAYIVPSAKRRDLERDGRYAFHNLAAPGDPNEFVVRGRATPIDDPATAGPVAARWSFTVDEAYRLFELSVESALLGERNTPDDWPPRYSSWKAR